MAQQQQGRLERFVTIFLIWLVVFFAFQYFMPKEQPAPQQTGALLAQADTARAEGERQDSDISRADRINKLKSAAELYEKYYQQNKATPEGMQARFQVINVYDYLATNLEPTSTRWYDQAESKLKEMQAQFHGQQGSVTLLVNGQEQSVSGDLGQIATDRLNTIRSARDQINKSKITYKVLDALVALTGRNPAFSYWFALVLIVVVLKVLTWPFQKKQHQYMQDMQRLQPQLKELQAQYKDNPRAMQQAQMRLFQENNVSVTGGCLPMLVMMVVLFPVFWMVRDYEFQFTNGMFAWIGSQYSLNSPWIADNLAQFDVPMFVIYIVSLALYPLLQPKPADPAMAQQQKIMGFMMPVMFGFMMWMGKWSSAFMFYWFVLNLVSMYQSWILMKQFGTVASAAPAVAAPAPAPAAPASGGRTPGKSGKSKSSSRRR